MSMVLGTYVPDHATPHAEICHSFVYRWFIACGLITGNYPDPLVELNTHTAPPILCAVHGAAVRPNANIHVQAGDIVGFWNGANNQGCFGVGTGRVQVANVNGGFPGNQIANPLLRLGWVGNGNQWRSMGGTVLTVTYRTPALVNHP